MLFVPSHDGIMLWKYFPHRWPFVRAIHQRASSHLSCDRLVIMEITTRYWLQNPCAICSITWWYHAVETLTALLALCEGNPPVTTGGFPSQRASNVDLWYFLCCKPEQAVEQTVITQDITWASWHLKSLTSSTCQWFEMPWQAPHVVKHVLLLC